MGAGTTQGGTELQRRGGRRNFGSRFSWYVEAVQRRVSGNWLQSTVDPSISVRAARDRDVRHFRNGTITNIQTERSSDNYSVDTSAVRAVQIRARCSRCPRNIPDRM